uniref:Uncharacterized protein n=1 Tax=Guillardia theta TaxID=55529 RepID=A0A7S4KEP5_GUITH|mmetsp:Transcript_23503/g.76558  ORF Transcript_23503/g.76558 Transcript_23503/m.76558 type:complete len:809 (+) Transcript_23503:463-2889(+)
MPPRANTKTPLDKRLSANAGKEEMSNWNIAELKQNLQEDSAILEQTLREANRLLGDSTGSPLIDVGGIVNKDVAARKLRNASDWGDDHAHHREDFSSGTFMTELDTSSVASAPTVVGGAKVTMSEELALRLSVLEQAIGKEAVKVLQSCVQSDLDQVAKTVKQQSSSKDGGRQTSEVSETIAELEGRIVEEEALKLSALEQVNALKENLRMQNTRVLELQDKLALLDSTSQEGGELLKKKETEIKSLKEELLAVQHKTRMEENERLKLVDRLRKKDVEMAKTKESMDKMTMQLQRLAEERDSMHAQFDELQRRYQDAQLRCSNLQQDLDKHQSAERVLKRNLQLQMPEEVKRVVKRVEELDKQNRELQEKLKQSKDHENHADMLRKNRIEITELRVSNKTLSAKVDELKKEKELLEKKSESERRLLENRTRNLFDLNVKSTQKLQGELDLRIAERLHNRSADNEVASLRRRNLELLGQINALDEQKMAAENKLRDAERKSRELKDKLELYATIHRIDLGKLQFSSDLNTEEELSAFLGDSSASSQGRKKKIRTQSRSVTPGLFSRPPPSAEDQKRSQSAQPGGGNWSGAAAEMSTTTGEQVRASARMEAEEESLEGLKAKVAQLQAKLTGEEKTKTNAQEKVIALAEQLVEKDRQITALQSSLDAEKETKKKKKKSERLRDLEGQVLSLITKVRETEMDKDQVEIKLNEKEEETKVKARKIGELIFKVSQLEEEKARIIEELAEVRIQAARQTKPEADPKSSTMPPRVIREESLGAGRMKISSSLNRPLKEETFSATMDRDRSEDIKT